MRAAAILTGLVLLTPACKTTPKRPETELHRVNRIAVETLRFRRPDRPIFDADTMALNPQLLEEKDHPRLDCEMPRDVMERGVSFEHIHECLRSLPEPAKLKFRLEWNERNPAFLLQSPEDAPACIAKSIAQLPVPREAVYQVEGACLAQRLEPGDSVDLKVTVSKETAGPDVDQTYRTLVGWVMSAFYDAKTRSFPAYYLPERFCAACAPRVKAHAHSTWWPPGP